MLTRPGEMNHEMRDVSEQYCGIENDYDNDNDNEEVEIDQKRIPPRSCKSVVDDQFRPTRNSLSVNRPRNGCGCPDRCRNRCRNRNRNRNKQCDLPTTNLIPPGSLSIFRLFEITRDAALSSA